MAILNTESLLAIINHINPHHVDPQVIRLLVQLKFYSLGNLQYHLKRHLSYDELSKIDLSEDELSKDELRKLDFDSVGEVDTKIIQKAVQEKISECFNVLMSGADHPENMSPSVIEMISDLTPFYGDEIFKLPERPEQTGDIQLMQNKKDLIRALKYLQVLFLILPLNRSHDADTLKSFDHLIHQIQAADVEYQTSTIDQAAYRTKITNIAQETLNLINTLQSNAIDISLNELDHNLPTITASDPNKKKLFQMKRGIILALKHLQQLLFFRSLNLHLVAELFDKIQNLINQIQDADVDYQNNNIQPEAYGSKIHRILDETSAVTKKFNDLAFPESVTNDLDSDSDQSTSRDLTTASDISDQEPTDHQHRSREDIIAPFVPPTFDTNKTTQNRVYLNLLGKTDHDVTETQIKLATNNRLSFLHLENCSAAQLFLLLHNHEANTSYVGKYYPVGYWTESTNKSPPITTLEIVNPFNFYDTVNTEEPPGAIVEKLCPALENNQTIASLVLNHTGINHQGLIILDRFLENHKNIAHLDLRNNIISSITETQHLGQLTSLDLSDNYLDNEDAKKIAHILEEPHCKITHLNLSNNTITDEGAFEIAKALAKNRSLRSLKLNGNQLSLEAQEAINETAELNKSVYGLELTETKASLRLLNNLSQKKLIHPGDTDRTASTVEATDHPIHDTKPEEAQAEKEIARNEALQRVQERFKDTRATPGEFKQKLKKIKEKTSRKSNSPVSPGEWPI